MNQPSTPSQPDPSQPNPSQPAASDTTQRGDTLARTALGIGVPVLVVALAYIPLLAARSDLPDRIASHFDISGTPDSSMSVTTFVVMMSGLIFVGLALCGGTAIRRPSEGNVAVTTGFLGGFLGALGAAILASTVVTQRGLDDWRDAGDAGWTLLVSLASASAVGALSAWLAAQLNGSDTPLTDIDAPVMALADGETAVWLSNLRSPPLLALGAASMMFGLVLVGTANWVVGAVVMASSIPLTALANLHVRVDRTGLRVKYGWLPRPTSVVDIADIATAQVIDVRPMEWGGWGYRGSLKLMRRAAVVHRAGPGIRVDLVDGKVFVVTVDDPEVGVSLLNAMMQQQAASQ